MLIKIDFRENKLIPLCEALNATNETIKIISENLPLGDIIICNDAGEEKVMIERKSLADLAASIRDGRYKEQGFRLNQCELHNHHIFYLVEGDLRYYRPFKGSPDKRALLSAMVSISYFKGFSLYRTTNLEETAEWIIHFATKLEKEGQSAVPYYSGGSVANSSAAAYAEVVGTRIKKDNITPANIGAIMLAQIPSVSSASAAAVMAKFNTMAALMTALQSDQNSLNDITTENKNGQQKKLTKPCINNIYNYLIKPATITIET
jgi:ERCC4-type nuclease